MCGFIAVLQEGPNIELSTARKALQSLTHRGPDAAGEWIDKNIFLGHRRLSIIDLATGDQPLQSSDGRYLIVFNGEIYNFLELRAELIREGADFRTRSDTEVIVEGYRRWGTNIVEKLHGMFAFVIWDRFQASAFAARDRLGIKPLCWAMYKGALIISSTLEPFNVFGKFNRIDLIAVRDLMTFDYIPTPRSILQEVHKLEPGSKLEWHLGSPEPIAQRYWIPPIRSDASIVPDEFELETLLECAVRRQMISDVPIGAFLSGGIDSSLIVAMMARHSSRPVRTFSVAFSEGNVDESSIAEIVAHRFGTEHTVLRAEELGAEGLLEIISHLDEPFCDSAFVPTFALSEMTKRYVKVALSGDGGDEVFGGYPKYLHQETGSRPLPLSSLFHYSLQALSTRPRGVGHIYQRTLNSRHRLRYDWSCYGDFPVFRKDMLQLIVSDYHDQAEVKKCFSPWEERARRYGQTFDTDLLMRTDLETYLSGNCLVKTDRASMLASLEVRVPYLDEMILERILPLPANQKIRGRQLKAMLMPIARRLLPREVWDRPKHGFNVPLDVWLAGKWKPAVEAALDWGELNFALFNYSYLRQLHKINVSEGGVTSELWNPFSLLAWAMTHSVTL